MPLLIFVIHPHKMVACMPFLLIISPLNSRFLHPQIHTQSVYCYLIRSLYKVPFCLYIHTLFIMFHCYYILWLAKHHHPPSPSHSTAQGQGSTALTAAFSRALKRRCWATKVTGVGNVQILHHPTKREYFISNTCTIR